ncbi:hypothetical protein F2Q70_00013078 [Brassica cretica]|uniref:Uncharacterized protein n=1 Tax=Brassica cretica TaxID=69181 RepID=A0A8S9LWE8_BRACR|nr:hypothetical protein F2Q70_00013078 [Brassica cretica]
MLLPPLCLLGLSLVSPGNFTDLGCRLRLLLYAADAGQWYSCYGMEGRGAETRWYRSKKKLDGDLVSYQGYYSSEVA